MVRHGLRGLAAVFVAICFVAGSGPWSASTAATAAPPQPRPVRNPHSDFKVHHAARRLTKSDPHAFSSPAPARSAAAQTAVASGVGGSWLFQGPQPITGEYGNSSGRVTSLAVDPTSSSVVYAGTAGGGVWKTTDAGAHWNPLTDSQAVLAIGALAVDPNNHLTVYAATGEADRCLDCYTGVGVMKSTDGGSTWTTYGAAQLAGHGISAIAVDRTNSNKVLVASSVGLFVSGDAGQTYALNASLAGLSPALPNGDKPSVDSLVQDPDSGHSGNWYAGVDEQCDASGFIGMSTDGGAMWTTSVRGSSLAGTPNLIRIGMGGGPGGVIYAGLAACANSTLGFQDGQRVAILKSANYAAAWSKITAGPDYFSAGTNEHQGWYDNTVGVDPTNSNRAVFGGITMISTTDGGATFTDVAKPYSGGPVHPDFHAVAFTGASSFYTGNDGGVWSTSDLGGTGTATDWNNLNATLALTTFYGGSASDINHMIGGAQDTGTVGRLNNTALPWALLQSGDGVYTQIRGAPSTQFYGELPYLTIFSEDYTNPSGAQLAAPCAVTSDPACTDPTYALAPFAVDPSSSYSSWIYGGTNRVWRSTTGGVPAGAAGWGAISGDLTTGTNIFLGGDAISAMAISPTGDSMAVGTYGGKLWRIDALHNSPILTDLTPSIPAFNFNNFTGTPWVSGVSLTNCVLTVPPQNNVCTVVATLGAVGVGRVWAIPYSGSTSDLTANLDTINPNTVIESVYATPANEGVYIGTSAGAFACFSCPSTPASWSLLGTGLPNSPVNEIGISADSNNVVAWTHGRGAWTMNRSAIVTASTNSLSFPTTTVAETSSQTITVSDQGLMKAQALGTISGPNASDFQIIFACSNGSWAIGVLAPVSTCNATINFSPTTAGAESATLTITNNSNSGTLTIALSGTGQKPAATSSPSSLTFPTTPVQNTAPTQTVTLTNQGPGNLHPVGWSFTGPNASSFGVNGYTCFGASVAPGGTCTINVSFTPAAAGPLSATFVINDNSTSSPHSVALSGTGQGISVSVSPSSLTFAPQDSGTTSAKQLVTITNGGPGTLYFYNLTLTGTNSKDFVADYGTCASVPSGSSCAIDVFFQPAAPGGSGRSATLNVFDNGTGSPQTIALSGTALIPVASVSPSPYAFGNQSVNIPATVTVTVTNSGSGHLVVSQLTTSVDYSVPMGSDKCTNVMVAAGASCTFAIQFDPARVGTDNGSVWVYDNTVAGVEQVNFTGSGIAPSPSAPPLQFGVVPLGQSATQTLTISNGGPGQMLISRLAISGPAANDFTVVVASDHCTGVVVAVNGSCTVPITFTPGSPQAEGATLSVFANYGGAPGFLSVSLSGTGGAAIAQANTGQMSFGSLAVSGKATQTLTVTNTGTMNLTVTAVSISGANASEFTVSADACSGTPVAPNGSCTVGVSFTPQTLGSKGASLTIASNSYAGQLTIALGGIGAQQSLGGILVSGPAASSWGPGESDVFVVGTDNALWYRHLSGNTWSGWQRLGGILTTKPASVSWGPNRIDVFVRGTDNGLWWMYWNGTTWSGWQSLGGILTSAPTVDSQGSGKLDVFVRGTDNGLWERSWNGSGWSNWQSLGGVLTADPAVVSPTAGRIDVLVRGGDGGLWHRYWDAAGWHSWEWLAGVLADAPSASSCASGEIDAYVPGTSGGLWRQIFRAGAWSGWQYLGNGWTSAPAAACETGTSATDVYERGTDQGLWHLGF